MGALALGRDRFASVSRGEDNPAAALVNRLTEFIPGDVLTLFVAGTAFISEQGSDSPPSAGESITLLIAFLAITPLTVLLGVWVDGRRFRRGDIINAGLAMIAFLVWSVAVPGTGWEQMALVAQHRKLTIVLAGVAGLLFSLFATGFEKRVAMKESLES